jgi:transposase InsO family protein
MSVNRQFPDSAQGQGVSLMSDNSCQPTSLAFMRACATLGIHLSFTSDNNPKGNADTARCTQTLKEECLWLHEWMCPFALISALAAWIHDYLSIDCIQLWVIRHPGSLNGTTPPTTALRSSPLDKLGALHRWNPNHSAIPPTVKRRSTPRIGKHPMFP